MSHTITILIPPGASDIKIEVDGVKGKMCTDITKSLEEALGGEVTKRTEKAEFYSKEVVKNTLKTGA